MSLADYYSDSYPPELWETPAAPVAAAAGLSALEGPATVPAGTVAGSPGADLIVHAGTPGAYVPAQTAAQRPRNVTELRERAQPAHRAPWYRGEYVLLGENGKRAHWDGDTWQRGESPQVSDAPDRSTVPPGTVGDA